MSVLTISGVNLSRWPKLCVRVGECVVLPALIPVYLLGRKLRQGCVGKGPGLPW